MFQLFVNSTSGQFFKCTRPAVINSNLNSHSAMNQLFRKSFWKNFAAEIEMLKNIIIICPDEIWKRERKIFYMVYHTRIFLDYYLTSLVKDFNPYLKYTLGDKDRLPPGPLTMYYPAGSIQKKNAWHLFLTRGKNVERLSTSRRRKHLTSGGSVMMK